jgi:hypothetical protein
MSIPSDDIVFLSKMMEVFTELMQEPKGYFERNPDVILPESWDLKITSAALYLLGDCYLRGKGLKYHPASKTLAAAMEALGVVWEGIIKEVAVRPYLYPRLSGVLGRGQASVELEWLLNGYSRWTEETS